MLNIHVFFCYCFAKSILVTLFTDDASYRLPWILTMICDSEFSNTLWHFHWCTQISTICLICKYFSIQRNCPCCYLRILNIQIDIFVNVLIDMILCIEWIHFQLNVFLMNLNKIANYYNIQTKFVQNIHICILIENTHFFHHKFRQMLFYAC